MQHQTVPQTREILAHELAPGMTVIDGTDGALVVTTVDRSAADSILVSFEGVPEPTLYGRGVTVDILAEPAPGYVAPDSPEGRAILATHTEWAGRGDVWETSDADEDGAIEHDTTTPEDRQLLADIHRWARTNGWTWHECWGWINAPYASEATLAVEWDNERPGVLTIRTGPVVFRAKHYDVDSVRQAVDQLVTLGILPDRFATSYGLGVAAGLDMAAELAGGAR